MSSDSLQLFYQSFPHCIQALENADSSAIQLVETRGGEMIPLVRVDGKDIALHSKFQPLKEAERFIDQIDTASHNLFVVTGFAFAYHIEVLLSRMDKDDVLLVIEKDPAIVKSAVENRNLKKLLSDKRVLLLIDPDDDELSAVLKGKSSKSVVFVTHRGSYRVDRDYYENISQMVKSYLSSKEVNIATLSKFQKLWTINCAKNSLQLLASAPVRAFYGKFTHCDAVVVGAGPSLRDSLDELKKIQESVLVIAVDTSLKICQDHGIRPHFVLCADPQLINARYFEELEASATILVADPACHPSVLRLYNGPLAMSAMPFDMFSWVEEISGQMGEITHGGSVSTNAYDFARRLGVDRVFLCGQDLAFSDRLAHCRGSYLDEMMFLKVCRFFNQEMFNRNQLRALPAIYQESLDGKTVQTNQKMMIFKQWFEKRLDPKLYNASAMGMKLSGITRAKLSDCSKTDDLATYIEEIYHEAQISRDDVQKRLTRVAKRVERIHNENELLADKLLQAVKYAEELKAAFSGTRAGNPQLLIERLNAIDDLIGKFAASKSIVGMSVQQTIHTIQEGYDVSDESLSEREKIAERSLYLYKGLLEGCTFTARVLQKMKTMLQG